MLSDYYLKILSKKFAFTSKKCLYLKKFSVMKTIWYILVLAAIVVSGCKKDNIDTSPSPTYPPITYVDYNQGLGSNPGYPVGMQFTLPEHIKLIGEIRGGAPGRNLTIEDKQTYSGPFPIDIPLRNWVTYGTGTYVNLYMKFYNNSSSPTTLTLPGGLIFCDTQDNSHEPQYQRGFLLQSVHIPIPPFDTAYVHLPCYCLNMHLAVPDFNTVYYIGPVTMNPNLNLIVQIMAPKQYPYGYEYDIQSIIWNVTDNGQPLTQADIQFLQSLP